MSIPAVDQQDHHHRDDHLKLVVRTPAGASHRFELRRDELVAEVLFRVVAHFVDHHELAAGDYGLAVIRDGQAVALPDTSRIAEHHLTDHDVLVLVPEAPQVDG